MLPRGLCTLVHSVKSETQTFVHDLVLCDTYTVYMYMFLILTTDFHYNELLYNKAYTLLAFAGLNCRTACTCT